MRSPIAKKRNERKLDKLEGGIGHVVLGYMVAQKEKDFPDNDQASDKRMGGQFSTPSAQGSLACEHGSKKPLPLLNPIAAQSWSAEKSHCELPIDDVLNSAQNAMQVSCSRSICLPPNRHSCRDNPSTVHIGAAARLSIFHD